MIDGIDQFDALPDGFLRVTARGIHEVCPRPTLIHLSGRREEPLFVSLLLHGNEDVGLKAVQQLLQHYSGKELPRSLSLFVANVNAARAGVRRLLDQPDYNRVWPGSDLPQTPLHRQTAQIVEEMVRRRVFASIDLHNNTGTNPHYACLCAPLPQHVQLASLFSRTVVYFTRPKGVQTMAFMQHCPAITCECGKVGDASGVVRAAELLDACSHIEALPDQFPPAGDVHLFHTVATVKVPEEVSIGFGSEHADLIFADELDHWNFLEIGPGAEIAIRGPGSHANLIVEDEQGRDCADQFIADCGNALRLKRKVLPSMLTLDKRIIRQDCLCYFMERYEF